MFLRRVFLLSILFGAVSWALHVRDLLPRGFAPIVSALTALFHGDGLIQSSLGAIGGVLGVDQEFDYVVAGGGTAGNVMGYRLAEAGFKVAIVEAGTFYELSKPVLATVPGLDVIFVGSSQNEAVSAADWKFSTASQQGAGGRNVHYAQGKCLGGSSAWNFMLQHRPTTGAFDKWAQTVGDDSYRQGSFEPFYEKTMTYSSPDLTKRPANTTIQGNEADFAATGQGGPVQVGYSNYVSPWSTWLEKGFKAVGLGMQNSFNRGKLLGYHYALTTIRQSDATRSSSVQFIYAAKDKGMQNLKVFTNADVSRITFDDSKKATGVEVLSAAGTRYVLKANKEVIVSGGAFKSPQLLMLSGIGPEDTLRQFNIPVVASRPGVGQNMWDHIFFGPSYPVNFPTFTDIEYNPIKLAAATGQYLLASGIFASNGIDILGWEKLPAQYRQRFSPSTEQALSQFSSDWPEVEYLGGNGYTGTFSSLLAQPATGKSYATILGALVSPLSRGNVTIASTSVKDSPVINPNWLTAQGDQDVAVALVRRMRDIWSTADVQSILDGPEYYPGTTVASDDDVLNYVRQSLMTVWHSSCTCKMGTTDDQSAVVDSQARVYGVKGVRVVDASAFPFLPPGHPQSTVYALAEKIADNIIKGGK